MLGLVCRLIYSFFLNCCFFSREAREQGRDAQRKASIMRSKKNFFTGRCTYRSTVGVGRLNGLFGRLPCRSCGSEFKTCPKKTKKTNLSQ